MSAYSAMKCYAHLFDGDRWPPRLFLVEDGETDGSGRIDIWMKEGWIEFAYASERFIR